MTHHLTFQRLTQSRSSKKVISVQIPEYSVFAPKYDYFTRGFKPTIKVVLYVEKEKQYSYYWGKCRS